MGSSRSVGGFILSAPIKDVYRALNAARAALAPGLACSSLAVRISFRPSLITPRKESRARNVRSQTTPRQQQGATQGQGPPSSQPQVLGGTSAQISTGATGRSATCSHRTTAGRSVSRSRAARRTSSDIPPGSRCLTSTVPRTRPNACNRGGFIRPAGHPVQLQLASGRCLWCETRRAPGHLSTRGGAASSRTGTTRWCP